jgi:tetratricopeptide (TPR) repeat protein
MKYDSDKKSSQIKSPLELMTPFARMPHCRDTIARLSDVIREKSFNPMAYLQRASENKVLQKYPEAVTDYTTSIAQQPNNPEAYWGRGNVHLLMHDVDKAKSDFNKSLLLQTQNPDAHCGIGIVHYLNNEYPEAIMALTTSINQQPFNPHSYSVRGCIYRLLGRNSDALSDLKTAQTQGTIKLEKDIEELTSSSLTTSTGQAATSPHISGAAQTAAPSLARGGNMPHSVCIER